MGPADNVGRLDVFGIGAATNVRVFEDSVGNPADKNVSQPENRYGWRNSSRRRGAEFNEVVYLLDVSRRTTMIINLLAQWDAQGRTI